MLQFGEVAVVIETLTDAEPEVDASVPDSMRVAGTSRLSWSEAMEGLALDSNRCPRAGEQLLVLAHGEVTSDVVNEIQALGGHVIMVDNVRESHLRLAGIERAKAVVILGDDDVRAIRVASGGR